VENVEISENPKNSGQSQDNPMILKRYFVVEDTALDTAQSLGPE